MKRPITLGIVLLAVGAAQAKTVALWPLNRDSTVTMSNDLRCRIDPANDLVLDSSAALVAEEPWALPPNPGADVPLDFAKNAYVVSNGTERVNRPPLTNARVGRHLVQTNDFTVEGWIQFRKVPDANTWYYLFGAMEGSGNKHRWFVSLRHTSAKGHYWCCASEYYGDHDVSLVSLGQSADFVTNGWHHIALSHDADNGSGKAVWKLYIDATLIQTVTENKPVFADAPTNSRFDIGGRTSGGNSTPAKFDYWRISDQVLEPTDFLNADHGDTPAPAPSPTVAYWKLDRQTDGTVNIQPSVGNNILGGLFQTKSSLYQNAMGFSPDCAFKGLPPNTCMSPAPAELAANAGSFHARNSDDTFGIHNAATELTPRRSFTLEAWMKPERRDPAGGHDIQLPFCTRASSGPGWQLVFKRASNRWGFYIYAADAATNGLFSGDAPLSGNLDLSDWHDWRHVALVYDRTAGHGTWSLYLNGVLTGSAENLSDPSDTGSYPTTLCVGGRDGAAERRFHGKVDYLRLSAAALAPNQFLCATDGAAEATNVLALYPLNVVDGAYFDGRDLIGNASMSVLPAADRRVTTVADAPVITNPDATPDFRGDRATLNGAVRFRDDASATPAKNAYLALGKSKVRDLINQNDAMTFECYIRRAATQSADWQTLYAAFDQLAPTYSAACEGLAFDPAKGFYIVNSLRSDEGDAVFAGTLNAVPVGEWHHVALTRTREEENFVFEFFVDGDRKATVAQPAKSSAVAASYVVIGGRGCSANSFQGAMSSVRFSNRVLAPSEFLCASGTPPSNQTLAYWPLDFANGALDVGSRVNELFGFKSAINAAGLETSARATVPRPDASADFIGNRKQNKGAVQLASGALGTVNLGSWTAPARACTIEGWLNWNGADGIIVQAGNDANGWKLFVEGGALKLYGNANANTTPFVDGTILSDASPLRNVWVHLALVYSNVADEGVWTLWIDGKTGGTIANHWMPSASFYNLPQRFTLGSLTGGYDLWRVSQGALERDEFLWKNPTGTLVLIH